MLSSCAGRRYAASVKIATWNVHGIRAREDQVVAWIQRERRPIIGQLPEERALLEGILASGFVDLGRALDPTNEGLFTWWAPWRNMRQRNIGWRLDYVLASEPFAGGASSCIVQADVGTSDHAPVLAAW